MFIAQKPMANQSSLGYWKWAISSGDPGGYLFNVNNDTDIRNNEWAPLVVIPLLAALMLIACVTLLIIFRQNPVMVITLVASLLVITTMYLTLATLGRTDETFE